MSRKGVEAPTFSLNGLTRQMILTSTYASDFDSIIRLRVGLLYQRNYLKCLLFHHPKMSAKWHSSHLSAPQTITAPYITQLPLKVSVLSLGQTADISLQPSLHVKVMLERFLECT